MPLPIPRLRLPTSIPVRPSALVLCLLLMLTAPLLSGCLERSTTVGDRFSGNVIVATTADNPRGAPRLDIPESMASTVTVEDYKATPPGDASVGDALRVGTQATYSNLTAGQLTQLGDIIANAFGDTAVTVDLDAKRSGDVVRFRASADLAGLAAGTDYVQLSVAFSGPITATSGNQTSNTTVSWTPKPGASSDFTAEATYADPATAAFGGWTWLMALICAIVVAVVIRLAYVTRYRGSRPGRPAARANTTEKERDTAASTDKSAVHATTEDQAPESSAAAIPAHGPGEGSSH